MEKELIRAIDKLNLQLYRINKDAKKYGWNAFLRARYNEKYEQLTDLIWILDEEKFKLKQNDN